MGDNGKKHIEISLSEQKLVLKQGDRVLFDSEISSAINGAGEEDGSECTPRGLHVICEKIGQGSVEGTVFEAREPSGEVYSDDLANEYPGRDWILTRILRLSGQEEGRNKGGMVDSYGRFIYIHGTPEEAAIGQPVSHGCIRMRNRDIVDLFDLVEVETEVLIRE